MPFDITACTVLRHYTNNPPRTEDVWYGPWIDILTTPFPSSQGYVVTPRHRVAEDSQAYFPDFYIEVAMITMSAPALTFRTVLIVKIKNSQRWESGNNALIRQIRFQHGCGL